MPIFLDMKKYLFTNSPTDVIAPKTRRGNVAPLSTDEATQWLQTRKYDKLAVIRIDHSSRHIHPLRRLSL